MIYIPTYKCSSTSTVFVKACSYTQNNVKAANEEILECCTDSSDTLSAQMILPSVKVIFQNSEKLLVRIQTKQASVYPWFTRLVFLKNSGNVLKWYKKYFVCIYTETQISTSIPYVNILQGCSEGLQGIEYFITYFA